MAATTPVPATKVTMLRMNPVTGYASTSKHGRAHPPRYDYRDGGCRHERLILDLDQRWAHCPDCDAEWKEVR